MSSTDPNKPKSGQRNRKAEQRSQNQKRNRQQGLKADERENPAELQISEPESRQKTQPDRLASPEPDHELMAESDQQQQNPNPGELSGSEPYQQLGAGNGQQQNEQPGQLLHAAMDHQLNAESEQQSPRADQRHDTKERVGATLDPAEIVSATGATAAAETVRVNFQTIANAYSDYTRKSLEQTRSYVEKLAGVRSLDKAMEAQAEFARQSYETFVAGSRRICELHRELARQAFRPLQRSSSDKRPGQR
jgi:phasin family protein